MSEVEQTAIETVAEAICAVPERRAMCAALMRIAGNALATFAGHGEAARTHSALARRHIEKLGRVRR
jgi:hypothetical protein